MSKIVTFGEIMLRLATPDHLRFSQARAFNATFGGGEANVAVSLANYGERVDFVTRLPRNDIAEACVGELRPYGVGVDNIVYGGERLGIYFLETGAVARPSKVIYDRAHSSISTIERGMIDWDEVFEGADWFHWTGITPAVSASAAEVCLDACRAANRLGVTVSCDLNYRKNLWKYGKSASEVMPALTECCDVILGNEEDAEKVFGIKPEGFDAAATEGKVDASSFRSVCAQLMARFPPTTTLGAACCTTARRSTSRPVTTSPTSSTAWAAATRSWAGSYTACATSGATTDARSNSRWPPRASSTPYTATSTR